MTTAEKIEQLKKLMTELGREEAFQNLPDYAKTVILLESFNPTEQNSSTPAQNVEQRQKELSLREIFNIKKPHTGAEKITLIGNYLEKRYTKEDFANSDILQELNKIKEPAPSNISMDINEAIRKGWVEQLRVEKNRKYCRTTHKGDQFIEKLPKRDTNE